MGRACSEPDPGVVVVGSTKGLSKSFSQGTRPSQLT